MIKFLENNIIKYFIVFVAYSVIMMILYYSIGTRNIVWFYSVMIAYVLDLFYFFSSLIISVRAIIGKSKKINLVFIICIFFIKVIIWCRNPILEYIN